MLYMRPVFSKEKESCIPMSIAVCTTDKAIIVDQQVLAHFDAFTGGRDIAAECKDWGWGELTWGSPIYA